VRGSSGKTSPPSISTPSPYPLAWTSISPGNHARCSLWLPVGQNGPISTNTPDLLRSPMLSLSRRVTLNSCNVDLFVAGRHIRSELLNGRN
jgi:hypothetical protein